MVCDKDGNEKVLAPPNCGATVVYRIGYYNILLPKTAHSEETLFVVLVNFYWMMQFNSCFAKGGLSCVEAQEVLEIGAHLHVWHRG